MLKTILDLDKEAFILINSGMANSILDVLCPFIRKQEIWYPLYAVLVYFLIKIYRNESWKILLAAAFLVVLTDQFSAHLIKGLFMRTRPCNEAELFGKIRHLTSSCNGYSFISAHATNHFGIALFISFFFKDIFKQVYWVGVFWAGMICFSQVYVGVHYPLDVLVGGLTGSLFGHAFAKYTSKYLNLAWHK